MIEKNKNNMKGLWSVLNHSMNNKTKDLSTPDYVINNNVRVTCNESIVNAFNDYFVNIGPHLASKIAASDNDATTSTFVNECSFFLTATNENEIIKIVNACKNKKSTDWSDLDMSIIKKVIHHIAKPLAYICNLSFESGEFPTLMKIAKVVPIHKGGDSHQLNNYRPISILPQFSKILEKLFDARLESFIDKHNLLSDCQYGFRKNRSTAHALIDLTEEVTNNIDNSLFTIGIFIDLQKAFDTIDHGILLKKLLNLGVRGLPQNWVKSYLTEREQYVQIDECISHRRNITCGVPQGSILGPKLFLLYINDLCDVSAKLKFILFADDTTILASGKDLHLLVSNITIELNKVKYWFNRNKLSLNITKTKMISFGKTLSDTQIQIMIDTVPIERVNEYTFLGVIISYNLSWRPQIKKVRDKVSKNVAIMAKCRYLLNQKALFILYCSLILPHINYCLEVWGNTYSSHLQILYRLQKKAIRIVHSVGYREHTNPLFLKSGILKLDDLIKLKSTLLVYNARKHQLPRNIQALFAEREGMSKYNLRRPLNLKVQGGRTSRKRQCASQLGVNLWNSLDDDIKTAASIQKFKGEFKRRVLEKYAYDQFFLNT